MKSDKMKIEERNEFINDEADMKLFLNFKDFKNKYLENSLKELSINKGESPINIERKTNLIILENEFYFLEQDQKAIITSNEEMLKYSNFDDEDINECRSENMRLIFKNFVRMKEIKQQILKIDCDHIIKDTSLLSIIDNVENDLVDYKDPKNNPLISEFIDRSELSQNQVELDEKFKNFLNIENEVYNNPNNEEDIIHEIDL